MLEGEARMKKSGQREERASVDLQDQLDWLEQDEEVKITKLQRLKDVIKMVFRKRQKTKHEEKLLWFLHTRAWLINIVFTLSRIAMKILKLGIYYEPTCVISHKQAQSVSKEQIEYYSSLGIEDKGDNWDSCIHYNSELLGPGIDVLDTLLWIVIFAALLVDILCYNYRHLAKYYIYIHIIQLTIARMLPNPEGEAMSIQPTQFSFMYLAYNMCFYCD